MNNSAREKVGKYCDIDVTTGLEDDEDLGLDLCRPRL